MLLPTDLINCSNIPVHSGRSENTCCTAVQNKNTDCYYSTLSRYLNTRIPIDWKSLTINSALEHLNKYELYSKLFISDV